MWGKNQENSVSTKDVVVPAKSVKNLKDCKEYVDISAMLRLTIPGLHTEGKTSALSGSLDLLIIHSEVYKIIKTLL